MLSAPVLVFDLDNTLYRPECGLTEAIDDRIMTQLERTTGLTGCAREREFRRLAETYGQVVVGLAVEAGIDLASSLAEVHDVDYARFLAPRPDLAAALDRLRHDKVVFSNAPQHHVSAVLEHLGLAHLFRRIISLEDLVPCPKPNPRAFRRLVELVGLPIDGYVFFDDAPANVQTAARLGIKSILVGVHPPGRPAAYWSSPSIEEGLTLIPALLAAC